MLLRESERSPPPHHHYLLPLVLPIDPLPIFSGNDEIPPTASLRLEILKASAVDTMNNSAANTDGHQTTLPASACANDAATPIAKLLHKPTASRSTKDPSQNQLCLACVRKASSVILQIHCRAEDRVSGPDTLLYAGLLRARQSGHALLFRLGHMRIMVRSRLALIGFACGVMLTVQIMSIFPFMWDDPTLQSAGCKSDSRKSVMHDFRCLCNSLTDASDICVLADL